MMPCPPQDGHYGYRSIGLISIGDTKKSSVVCLRDLDVVNGHAVFLVCLFSVCSVEGWLSLFLRVSRSGFFVFCLVQFVLPTHVFSCKLGCTPLLVSLIPPFNAQQSSSVFHSSQWKIGDVAVTMAAVLSSSAVHCVFGRLSLSLPLPLPCHC